MEPSPVLVAYSVVGEGAGIGRWASTSVDYTPIILTSSIIKNPVILKSLSYIGCGRSNGGELVKRGITQKGYS